MQVLTRRGILTGAAAAAAAGASRSGTAAPLPFALEAGSKDIRQFKNYHAGLGSIGMRMFDFGGASAPAYFLTYDIPPGASEGVHVHNLKDPALGPFDEYYYIVEGRGRMMIDGKAVMVGPGDHVHTPLNVAHGIENVTEGQQLKVFLTYIDRSAKA
jgi:uncharacterized cupin superfamily protein